MKRTMAVILAGGEGERLSILSSVRAKPAVPFAGKYRIIDFTLSNCVNSLIDNVVVLTQYNPRSLNDHIGLGRPWDLDRNTGGVKLLQPYIARGRVAEWYRGTADAVLQNLNLIDDFNADVIAIFGSDHIYRMDVAQMLGFHQAAGADVTIATRPVPVERASSFGVLRVDRRGCVAEFAEKPQAPAPMPDTPASALVSMGNYLFSRQALTDALLADARRSTDHDFGRSIIPELVASGRVYAYDFQTNEVPGVKPYEEGGYWRDVGTIEAYWEAHMDLLGESPRFDLDNRSWPIRSEHHPGPAARFIGGDVDNAQIGEASLVKRATIRNSILGRSVWVNEGAVIEDSIVMDHTTVGKGAHLRRAIIDRFNIIPADTEIGIDPAQDARRFHVDQSGLVVVPRGGRRDFLRDVEEF